MTEIKIQLPDDRGLCEVTVAQLHKAGFHEFANQIAKQLQKAPVEEPTEQWSVVLATDRDGWRTERTLVHDKTSYRWVGVTEEGAPYWLDWAHMSDVEVLRVGIGEPASPAEAVEADKPRPPQEPCVDPECPVALMHSHTEPSPEQVEAEGCVSCGYPSLYQGACTECGRQQPSPAPAEDDPIEAAIIEFTHAADSDKAEFWTTVQWRKHHDWFAARVLEVGRQQPGVPVEAVRALRDRFDKSAKRGISEKSRDYGLGARDTCIQAVRALSALLPEEPTS